MVTGARTGPAAAQFVRLRRENPEVEPDVLSAKCGLDVVTGRAIAAELKPRPIHKPTVLKAWASDEGIPKRIRNHLAAAAEALEADEGKEELRRQIAQKRKELEVLTRQLRRKEPG